MERQRGRYRGVGARTGVVALLTATLVASACSSGSSSAGTSPSTSSTSSSSASGSSTTSGATAKSARGFDGTTIKVAGMGGLSNFAGAEIGAEARFKRANDTNELKGIKIQFVEMADDKGDPATGTSEARRLVTEDKVFAIVPDLSAVNPGPYLAQQHVPYVGYAFDSTYCTATPSTAIWGFGYDGCLVPKNPPVMPDSFAGLYTYVTAKTGKKTPSMVIFDQDIGKFAPFVAVSAKGAGFNVVAAEDTVPAVVSDYSPYIQRWISADQGHQPDVISCYLAVQCVAIWQSLKAAGFKGIYFTPLGPVDVLAKAMAGTVTSSFYNAQTNPGLTQLEADLEAFKPGTKPTGYSNVPAYFAADMFIQALKKVGGDITPEAVQKVLATQTWQIPDLVGPIEYPASTVVSTPSCSELLEAASDGSGYTMVEPYTCSSRSFKTGAA